MAHPHFSFNILLNTVITFFRIEKLPDLSSGDDFVDIQQI